MDRPAKQAGLASIVPALICAAVVVAALAMALAPAPLPALAAPSSPTSGTPSVATSTAPATRTPVPLPIPQPPAGLDEATRRATEMQQELEDLRAEVQAIETRLVQTDERVYRQAAVLERARQEARAAQSQFDERMVSIYKAGHATTLELLFSARSFAEVLDRGVFLFSVIDRDQAALHVATKLSAEAAYEAKVLGEMRAREAALRDAQAGRLKSLTAAVARQRSLVAKLTAQQKAYVDAKARFDAAERRRWKASSYLGPALERVTATVDPYTDRSYIVDAGEPTSYTTTGRTSTELCSWYGNARNGTTTASGRAFNENEFTCATVMKDPDDPLGTRLLPFGTRLALTRGDRRIVVAVTDRGPYVEDRRIDLSRAAAEALGFDGVSPVTVEIVTPK